MDIVYRKTVEIRYSDTDPNGRFKPVGLLNCLQDVASEHAGQMGISGWDMLQRNLAWVVRNYHIRVHRYPKWQESVLVDTWRWPQRNLYELRQFVLTSPNGQPIADAVSSWLIIGLANKRPLRLNRHLPANIEAVARPIDHSFNALLPVERSDSALTFKVRRQDLDFNCHVNNTVYICWALESAVDMLPSGFCPSGIDVIFQAEAVYGDQIAVQTQKIDGPSDAPLRQLKHTILRQRDGQELCRLQTIWRMFNHSREKLVV